jgi:HEAT repeat protein
MPAHDLEKLLSTAAGTAPSEVAASLAEVLRNENADVRRTAIGYLADPVLRDHVPMDLLAEACHDPDPYVCYEATMSLGELGAKAARAASTLADLMESGDGRLGVLNTRQAAAFALGRIGPGAAVAVPALLRVLKDPDPQLRIAAAWTLSLIDPTISDSLPVLIENLSSVREPDRRNAADAMGRLGPLASEAILALEKALGDEVPAVRRSAERALQLINREQPNDRHADMSG